MKKLIFAIFLLSSIQLCAQMPSYMKLISGGTFNRADGYEFYYEGYKMMYLGEDTTYNKNGIAIGEIPGFNTKGRRITVSDFYLSDHEVSNKEYFEFLFDSLLHQKWDLKTHEKLISDSTKWSEFIGECKKNNLFPNENVWTEGFPYLFNDPMLQNYFKKSLYLEYPVVGVTWNQCKVYCLWLTEKCNEKLIAQNKSLLPNFRLPTEAEWEYTCQTGFENEYQLRFPPFQMNIKTTNGVYNGDNQEFTAPIKTFKSDKNKLWQMKGNVAEWMEDVFISNNSENSEFDFKRDRFKSEDKKLDPEIRVVKGGSWADYHWATLSASRTFLNQNKSSSRIGFRVAMIKVGTPK